MLSEQENDIQKSKQVKYVCKDGWKITYRKANKSNMYVKTAGK